MYQDKNLQCRDCGVEFVFTAGEQEFYASVASPTSPLVAPAAVKHAKTPVVKANRNNAKCSKLLAPNVAKLLMFLSVPPVTARYIAKIATLPTTTATKI